jgi:hypothetical protein
LCDWPSPTTILSSNRGPLRSLSRPLVSDVERWLTDIYVAAEGASLRQEDRRKARQVTALLGEIAHAVQRCSRKDELVLVDAAAGKSYVGLLAAKLILEPLDRPARVITIERDPARVAASRRAAERLSSAVPIECRQARVESGDAWPASPSIVVALHACGAAADGIIERTIASRARVLLLVPCCTSRTGTAAIDVEQMVDRLGVPRHAPRRRRIIQSLVDAGRTQQLEAAGYQTEVVEFVGATVTPHNLLWRARLVEEPVRAAAARRALERLRGA